MNFENKESVISHFLKKARLYLYKKHSNDITNKYNILKINDILSNSNCRLVSLFKDYLLYEDYSEFLKRYYNEKESKPRIKKFSKYLNQTSFIYPCYAPLEESKYIFANILKKQMIINKQKRKNMNNKYSKKKYNQKKFFNNSIYNDILGLHKSESFINFLFGLNNNNTEENEKNDKDELNRLINIIENNEKFRININKKFIIEKITVNTLNSNLNKNRKDNDIKVIFNRQKKTKRDENYIRKDNSNNLYSKEKITITNNGNEETKDNSSTNIPYKKQKLVNYKSMIYHPKLKSNLSGNINKLDLPSNSNIVNLLKRANEAFAEKNKVNKEQLIKVKNDFIYDSKKNILAYNKKSRQNRQFMSCNDINEIIKKKALNKKEPSNLTRNINDNNSLFKTTKSIYVKSRVIKNNISNGNIFKSVNEYNKLDNDKIKIIRPYSKPKYICDEIKYNHIYNKTQLNVQNRIVHTENI